jgi:hypothetical protein
MEGSESARRPVRNPESGGLRLGGQIHEPDPLAGDFTR